MGTIFLVYVGMYVGMLVCRYVGLSTKTTYAKMREHTVKNGVKRYTLIDVVEEVLFQHPCLASIFSCKIPVECIPTLWTNS